MDNKERERLREEYQYLSDEEIIELFQTDKEEFPEGVYEIVLEEFQKRGLQKKIDEMKRLEELRKQAAHEGLAVVKTFPYRHYAEAARGLLEDKGIEAIVLADDAGGYRPHIALGMVKLLVKEENIEKAQEILKVLDHPDNPQT
ncbi:MAG: DUF2007 domain-containing protein [Candidatus Omnitrophota bacterium]|nr:MAG: DUF2007 domain-containing protein [Candidatus Omnitrophota bacterium]